MKGLSGTRIQRAAEPYFDVDDQLFAREFKRDFGALEDPKFLFDHRRWRRDRDHYGVVAARLERQGVGPDFTWVAIHPDYQGRGLAKPMMSVAMAYLKRFHERSFLGTSSGRIPAIKVYLDFGFYPDLERENSQQAWGGSRVRFGTSDFKGLWFLAGSGGDRRPRQFNPKSAAITCHAL